MKDYQIKKEKEYVLPETVYRQALWAVKDLPRMKVKLAELEEETGCVRSANPAYYIGGGLISDNTGRMASEKAMVSLRIEAIEGALDRLPEKNRKGILEKLAYGKAYGDEFHMNTWKKWQQIYIYWVAKDLNLF